MGHSSPNRKLSRKSTRDSVIKKSPKASTAGKRVLDAAPASFTRAFFANVMSTDLASFSATDRERMSASIWSLAQERQREKLKLRVFNPSPMEDGWTVDHTVVEIVNDDMPFLVDSVASFLQQLQLTIHLVIHPVLRIERDKRGKCREIKNSADAQAESFIHVQIDHCLDQKLLKDIETGLYSVLSAVRSSVEDWHLMRQRMQEAIAGAIASKHQIARTEDVEEIKAFLQWLDDHNFTYLGYRDIDLTQKDSKLTGIKILSQSGLGILRDPEVRMFGGLRDSGIKQNPKLQNYVQQNHLLVVTKTNQLSCVHRSVPMDAIFVRRFNTEGNIIGERLFVGLFTSQSYSQNPLGIPFLRHKIKRVLASAGFPDDSHDGKLLIHILNNYPHDELFQISEEDLYANSLGILQLQERARFAMFTRRDPFERFVTCLLYVPRDRYKSSLRNKIHMFLENAFQGKAESWNVRIDDSVLARAFVTIQLSPQSPRPDMAKLEADLRELCRGWPDRLRESLVLRHGEATALALLNRYDGAFSPAYRDVILPENAVDDIRCLERSKALETHQIIVDLSEPDEAGLLHLKLFQADRAIALSEALPLIENMGLKIEYMTGPFEIIPKNSDRRVFVHEFVGCPAQNSIVDFQHVQHAFEEALGRVWQGEVENDPFNALTLRAGMSWQEIRVLRAFARYLRQLRIPYSHEMMASTFVNHPQVAQQIYALFFARHNPDLKGDRANRCRDIEVRIQDNLMNISALEEDRIIRRYVNLVQASLRTNAFQPEKDGTPKTYVSFKFDSRAVEFMPLPKPLYEIFIYSPRVEAVHLRGGKVARGGIRWSDRRDDFRNEILGLMKAQMVKNSVIVPVGSKGGFIVKKPPAEADKYMAEGIACYRIMMCGLLDITDNREGNRIIPPSRVVRHDNDDPYLVVAADKGTAKFSDIANGISQEYGFWLDDAFASGGSAGYDHKGMGITARGAWEAIKRHFRELGKDIQTTDFTVLGVGDMSGDVFGNGVLLSKHIRLLGAFDHRHIFCDPNPDAATGYTEREKLFKMPRSSWADYDARKISKGGGVFARSEKTIKISSEMKKAYGISADILAPSDLIQALLKADVELLYFGGIGTYVKATTETNEDVGDRATDALRIDATEIRARVIGEGANLGMTQRGRTEYALKGGRLNTDAIDNSAGVDTSDHEVNIKVLLRKLVDKGGLSLEARNKLLASMTDDVAQLVLVDNYYQTQALSIAEAQAPELLGQHERCMQLLERTGLLNRTVEFLPDSAAVVERRRLGKGMTRPELAVLMAYSKIWLYEQLLDSGLPDDNYFQTDLVRYFPEALQKKYAKEIDHHQLRREIIATAITNSTVNRCGIHPILVLSSQTGQHPAMVTRAYVLARETFGLRGLWRQIEALDNSIPAQIQTQMLLTINQTLFSAMEWFLEETDLTAKLAPIVAGYTKGIEQLLAWIRKSPTFSDEQQIRVVESLKSHGVSHDLASRVAVIPLFGTALGLTRAANNSGNAIGEVAEIFFALEHRLSLGWLRDRINAYVADTPWQREALAVIGNEILAFQKNLTIHILKSGKKNDKPSTKLGGWMEGNAAYLDRYDAQINEWKAIGKLDLAMLTLASRLMDGLLV